ncbi:MAG: hypothetical protein WA635_05685 [Gallionella sp.]
MLKSSHILAAILMLALPHAAKAESLADKFKPGTSYYFDHFDPGQKPWEPGQYLNIEEVFKNYQYFEIVFDQDGKGITVYRYLRGSKEGSEKYLVLPDQSLLK